MPGNRLFFALRPSPLARNLIGVQRDQLGLAESVVENDRLHITLAITEDFARQPYAEAKALIAIGEQVSAAPVPVRLDRVSGSNETIALRPSRKIDALAELGAKLQQGLARAGLLRGTWDFHPHVTLLYRKGRPFTRTIDPISWDATDFVLIHSILGAHRHIELGRWPLEDRQGAFGF
ncbi:2'-5' RNA ligase family protein [Sphingomonas sp. HITSZ_GF]|uniref:2'-5' RNA ligase family protein n=1 Tax=Sphingomonas sp. HITSZ_GF TaxID=3037247 RepID=UPI00240DAB27|nr:2'-5' RNA ligase family protein [Sphingomonas sp. HITSZ_GF]MDG2533421.1 2'-5' RNA ligase family protein [Sphingomonas sp. HITSZ_GF]